MFRDYAIRKLKRIGTKFDARLLDAAQPLELLFELTRYRQGGEAISLSREHEFVAYALNHIGESKAQLYQDLFALFQTGGKRNGYFVEFGATDGVTFSNTCLLEKGFGWFGILAEPARGWHDALRENRQCIVETRCVWSRSGENLEFIETLDGGLSTINAFSEADGHSQSRKRGINYSVETISLNDLLESHGAPAVIDYLSVDTEGSEFTILNNFDFSKFDIRIITVEHNFTPERDRLQALLQEHGYIRVLEKFTRWEDWYVKSDQAGLAGA